MSISQKLKPLVDSKLFNILITGVIIFSAILVGVSLDVPLDDPFHDTILFLEIVILAIFTIEILARIFAEEKPLNYFMDPWNMFDFVIVAISFIPLKGNAILVIRLIRLLRTFRLFKIFPNLRPVIRGIVNSISSVIFVALLLGILVYIYAVIGVSLFGSVDDLRFGTLWRGLFTLFQILTLENWNTIMLPANSAYPIGGPLYFVSFIILGTMIIMNLFVGVIVGNMGKAMDKLNSSTITREYLDEDASRERQIAKRLERIENKLDHISPQKSKKKKRQ